MWFRRGLSEEDSTNSERVPFMGKAKIWMCLQFEEYHSILSGPDVEKKSQNILWSDQISVNFLGALPEETFVIQRERNFTEKITNHEGGNARVWSWFSSYKARPIFSI